MNEEIVRLAARGDGVTASGRHVAKTAPGDLVSPGGEITPGPHRETPPCRHFGTCGGCQLQHIDEESYKTFLVDRVRSALAAQGLAATIFEPNLSPPGSRRRTSLRAMRRGKQVTLGYAEAGSHTLVDVRECPVLRPELFALLGPLRGLMGALLPDSKTATLRMTLADQGIDLLIEDVEVEGLAAVEALSDFGIRHRLARISVDEGFGPSARYEPEPVTINLGGFPVPLPEGAFLQATPDAEAALSGSVFHALRGSEVRADLFAGLGTFTFWTGAVYAAEGARDAMLALQATARQAVLSTEIEHRDLFRRPLTVAELARFDGVVLDPPRAGAREQVAQLAASSVSRIAYASCNPATFARDARVLVDGGYQLEWVSPVGQFRWSTHVELVGAFVR